MLTSRGPDVGSKTQERIVGDCCLRTPDVGKGTFDKHQTRATEETGEESANN